MFHVNCLEFWHWARRARRRDGLKPKLGIVIDDIHNRGRVFAGGDDCRNTRTRRDFCRDELRFHPTRAQTGA